MEKTSGKVAVPATYERHFTGKVLNCNKEENPGLKPGDEVTVVVSQSNSLEFAVVLKNHNGQPPYNIPAQLVCMGQKDKRELLDVIRVARVN